MSTTVTKKKPKTSARKQRAQSKHGRIKKPNYQHLYSAHEPAFDLDQQRFRTLVLRPDMPDKVDRILHADTLLQGMNWRSQPGNPVLEGDVTFMQPDIGPPITLHDGHVVKLDVAWGGGWREVWSMRMYDGQDNLDRTRVWQLFDDGKVLQDSIDFWHFTKNKHKKKGWLCHEIATYVADRYRIPLGKISQGTHYITDISGEYSPMQVLQRAYAIERRNTGRRFTIRWHIGHLWIVPLVRNPLMYLLGPMIQQAAVGREPRDQNFATAVTVKATLKGTKGTKKKHGIRVQYADEQAIKAEGFVHKDIGGGDVKSEAEALDKAKRYIAHHSHRKRTITGVTHQGIAFIRRGDAMEVNLPQYGFSGNQGVCFVSSGDWSLSSGTFSMSLNVTFDDPYLTHPNRKAKDKATRAKKRASRKKH